MSALGLELNIPALLGEAFYAELNKYNWGLRYHMTETANPIVNQAAPGTANGTASNVAFAQPGGIEGRTAVDYNAANSIITAPNSARWILNDFTVVFFFNADSSPASGWRVCQNVGDQLIISPKLDGSIEFRVNRATANATYTCAAGEISYPTGLMMLAMSYDETNGIVPYRGKNGTLTPITGGGANTIGSGATVPFTGTLNMGNATALNRGLDGRSAYLGFSNPRLSQANLQGIVVASGV